jgi:hypothetical protein
MPAIVAGLLAGVILGIVSAGLSLARSKGEGKAAAAVNFFGNVIVTGLAVTWPVVGHALPTATFAGVLPLIFADLVIAFIIACAADAAGEGLSAAPVVMILAVLASGIGWIAVHNGPHDAHKAAFGIVHVTTEPGDALPASSTSDLVVVTPDEAATRASQAMSSGISATRNFATYTNLGPATLQRVDGKMQYVFPLEFDGAGNKQRLHAVVPGYVMISAEDPNAAPVERYDGRYTMVVSLAGGQGSEPLRYVRDHLGGATAYTLEDPTLEIQDGTGDPYWTVTMDKPQLGTTFPAPVATAVINAHTGHITRYDLPGANGSSHDTNLLSRHLPWIDRVYSVDDATRIANWYGRYAQAGWGGVGSTNANRFQVSGDPVLTYTGDENPSWRILLTSFNTETSVNRIVELDSATGAMRIYRPAAPMGIETTVASAFCNAQGIGAGQVKSNHLVPEHMSLHVIDGTLVWMASFESSQNNGGSGDATSQQPGDSADPCGNGEAPVTNPTFTGVGFVPAYSATASNAVFGNTRSAALANLFSQLAAQQGSNGNAPGAGASEITVTGKICEKDADTAGGNETYYITLCGAGGKPDFTRLYTGTSGSAGPALVLARTGDDVALKVFKVTSGTAQQQIQGFSDKQHPVSAAGA